ncbi:MAG: hypothetical protein AAGC93_21435 [Cyanobacteria bacterium P01_F01_bin.53]
MEKHIKRRIRNTWRNRLLLGVSSLAVLGFSVFQFQTALKHRTSDLPPWALDFTRSAEQLTDENLTDAERDQVVVDILDVAQSRNLVVTTWLLHDLSESSYRIQSRELVLTIARARARALDLDRALDRAQQQVIDSGLAAKLTDDMFLVLVITADLEHTHGLIDNEPTRTRALRQSAILLGVSTVILIGLLVMLIRIQGSSKLPRTANLIAFLPEECVAELGYLESRLKQAKKPHWQIRRRLIHEFVFLLWAHYVQMQIDNLFLGSGEDHTIDD